MPDRLRSPAKIAGYGNEEATIALRVGDRSDGTEHVDGRAWCSRHGAIEVHTLRRTDRIDTQSQVGQVREAIAGLGLSGTVLWRENAVWEIQS